MDFYYPMIYGWISASYTMTMPVSTTAEYDPVNFNEFYSKALLLGME